MKKAVLLMVLLLVVMGTVAVACAQEVKMGTTISETATPAAMAAAIDAATSPDNPFACTQVGPVTPWSYVYSYRVGAVERVVTAVRYTVQFLCPQKL